MPIKLVVMSMAIFAALCCVFFHECFFIVAWWNMKLILEAIWGQLNEALYANIVGHNSHEAELADYTDKCTLLPGFFTFFLRTTFTRYHYRNDFIVFRISGLYTHHQQSIAHEQCLGWQITISVLTSLLNRWHHTKVSDVCQEVIWFSVQNLHITVTVCAFLWCVLCFFCTRSTAAHCHHRVSWRGLCQQKRCIEM